VERLRGRLISTTTRMDENREDEGGRSQKRLWGGRGKVKKVEGTGTQCLSAFVRKKVTLTRRGDAD